VIPAGGMTVETNPVRGVIFNGKEASNSDRLSSSIGSTSSLSAVSVEMWVKLADNGSTQNAAGSMLFSWDPGSGINNYNIYHRNDQLGFNTFNSEMYGINSSSLNNKWQHLVFVMTNSGGEATQKIFVNGTSQTPTCLLGVCARTRSFSSTGNFVLMDNNFAQNTWNAKGSIGLARVYGQELTQSQVSGLFDATKNDGYLNNVTASGVDPVICNQFVGNTANVIAYRLDGGDCVVEFKNVGSTNWTVPSGISRTWVLAIGGGGAGGGDEGGGGGAGGYREETVTVTDSQVAVSIGQGGVSTSNDTAPGGNGGNSSFGNLVALGGGGGGTAANNDCGLGNAQCALKRNGVDGGSGGGGAGENQTTTTGGSGAIGQGNAGAGAKSLRGSGGGGAGSIGFAGNDASNPGQGGSGKSSLITGQLVTRAGGGGGGCGNSTTSCSSGSGGAGGGGAGGYGSSLGSTGVANTGGGGGGAGNTASLLGFSGGSGIVVVRYSPDQTAPTVTEVSSSSSNARYTTGSTIPITVTFSEAVTVTGTPQLTLETGSTDRTINYSSGSGSTILTFNYVVQAGDTSSDLDYVATNSLTLNGGTIRDAASNDATLTLPTPGGTGSLGANKAIIIDTTAPSLSSLAVASSGTSIILTYVEDLSANTALVGAFTVTRGGSETITISSRAISGSTVTLTLGSIIYVGQSINLSYSDLTGGDDANTIQDLAGNDAASFSNQPVTNNSTVLNPLSTPTTLAVTTTETSSATFSFTATTNASSHTLRLYESSTATLLSTTTSFASGSSRTGLTPATQYYATLQAVGDGITYESSSASSPVYFTTAIRKPVITSQPIDTSTTTSRNAGFAVTATSADSGSLSYQWQQSTDSGVSFTDIPSANAATLSISSVTSASNGYRYRVVVTNSKSGVSASETSTSATLTVNGAIALSGGSNISKAWNLEATSLPITASGGTGGITFTISRSAPEVLINSSTGEVTSPAEVMARGTYNETITATDERGATATKSITITVGVGTPTITLRFSAVPMKGFNLTITATTSTAGTVRFFEKGRVIAGCKARATTGVGIGSASLGSGTATCLWKPRIHGPLAVKAVLTPTSGDYASVSTSQDVVVVRRTSR